MYRILHATETNSILLFYSKKKVFACLVYFETLCNQTAQLFAKLHKRSHAAKPSGVILPPPYCSEETSKIK